MAWCFAGLVILNAVAGVVLFFKAPGWQESRERDRRLWRKGDVTHTDRDGDGRVDEIEEPAGNRERHIRRDTDGDGFLDVRYLVTSNGVATRIEAIHEKAPRH